MAETVRPPYASGEGIQSLFQRVQALGPPKKVDAGWAEGIQKSQPGAIIGLLRWLGVVDAEGNVDKTVWQKLRTDQVATLGDLVRESYSDLFETVDVETADLETLNAAFIQAYDAGAPQKPVKAFLTLCDRAGIVTTAKAKSTPQPAAAKKSPPQSTTKKSTAAAKRAGRRKSEDPPGFVVDLQVVIPPEWDADQVRERVQQVADAVRLVDGGT